MTLQAFVDALGYFWQPSFVFFVMLGIIIGIIVGIIPGIGGMVTIAIMLPFTFQMKPEHGLPLMLSLLAAQFTGGSITAILLNVPGTNPNAATLLDGFPMTQKGAASRALGAAVNSSMTGGVMAAVLALAFVPIVLKMILGIQSADMVFIILMGLTFIAVLGRGSMIKGLISGGLGLMLSFIGYQFATAVPRFTFGSLYLYEGLPLIPVCLGLFGIPTVFDLAASGSSIAQRADVVASYHEALEGAKDVFRHWWLWLRSTVIGYIIGVIPGIGAEVAVFVAYGHAKQTSKHPEKFGTGIVEGVIAPESANNASVGGALLTTLALGIPGSSVMAIFIGAMLMMGLTPGPETLTTHLDLSLALLLVVVFSNILGGVICFVAAPKLARVSVVPANILVPLVLVITLVGAFAYRGSFADIWMTLVFGLVGIMMARLGYNRPALFLGYILGGLFEKYFFMALGVAGPMFFLRPVSLALIGIIVISLALNPIRSALQRNRRFQRA